MTRKKGAVTAQAQTPAKAVTALGVTPPVESGSAPVSGPAAAPDFPIVGIGASAGGLAAFEAFFSGMPADTDPGMAFVLVQHLAPDHKSMLTELIGRCTRMRVLEVEDGMEVRQNRVYIIPANRDLTFAGGALHLFEPSAPRGLRLSIDHFFRSLALDQGERTVCIVLSGTGSDGTAGVRAVKGAGGLVIAQDPESTENDGMPRSAIATGLVDYVLAPAEMPDQLIAYAAHAFGKSPLPGKAGFPKVEATLKKICLLLLEHTGHDFSQYKQSTLTRRVERRMAVHQIEGLEEYLRYLQAAPLEAQALFRDLLIGVTNFFRDPEAFAVLEREVIPKLFAGKPAGAPVRVWSLGCATGEEAYSLAILLQERLETLDQAFRVQVFATDLDALAIEQARSGLYPAGIAADLSPERLARFFVRVPEGGYRVKKILRDCMIFSEQDVIKDPPFSRVDLILCRNLLIYLNGELQRKLIPLFHYALNPKGVLFLGSSESVGDFASLFATLDRKHKLYRRQIDLPGATRPPFCMSLPPLPAGRDRRLGLREHPTEEGHPDLRELTEQTLLAHYAQAAVLVNGRGEILHFYGRTGRYLEPAQGDAGMNILAMAREGLRPTLTTALYKVVVRCELVQHAGLRVKTNGDYSTVNLSLRPVQGADGAPVADLFLVIFREAPEAASLADAPPAADGGLPGAVLAEAGRIAALEQQLRTKEEYLQNTLEEMETSHEEIQSTNEELQSVNEELQSTNEELETSKEELQSVNEELITVNAELQVKVADLSRVNNDMNNLLAGTGVATLFVDRQLRILRFTPTATEMLNLIPVDIGRSVSHIVSNLAGYDRLVEDVQGVLRDLALRETEVRTRAGAWFLLRILPYRTLDNVVEGAVISFTDITELRQAREAALDAQVFAEAIVNTVREPLLVLDGALQVVAASRAFYRTFRAAREATIGRQLYDLGNHQWDIPSLRKLLEEILPRNTVFDDFEVTHEFEQIGRRMMLLNARRIPRQADRTELILLAIEDITGSEGKTP